jgi:hypothetical protein
LWYLLDNLRNTLNNRKGLGLRLLLEDRYVPIPADLKNIANESPKKLAKVFYAGMGFMMCRKGALEKVTYPWFEPAMHEIDISKDFSSEDVSLCWKWKDAGVDVWVDPDVIFGHEKQIIIR